MTKIAMVIVNYNDAKTTKKLLENIKDYSRLSLIIIVDNHSTDDSLKQLKQYENKKIKIVESKENKGYAAGLNIGAKYALEKLKECHIIFSNSDIIIHDEKDLEKLGKDLDTKEIAVVGPTIVENKSLNRGWKMPSITNEILQNLPWYGKHAKKKNLYQESHYQKELSFVDVVSGCIFAVDGKVLEEIGYFDENTFLYYEEQILSQKLKKQNQKVAVDNEVIVIHNHSVTINQNMNQIKKYKQLKESQRYFVKNYLQASRFQVFLLDMTKYGFLILLYIKNFLKGGR